MHTIAMAYHAPRGLSRVWTLNVGNHSENRNISVREGFCWQYFVCNIIAGAMPVNLPILQNLNIYELNAKIGSSRRDARNMMSLRILGYTQ